VPRAKGKPRARRRRARGAETLERGGDLLKGPRALVRGGNLPRGIPPPPTPAWQRSLALIRIDQGLFGKALGVNSPLIPAEALSKIFKEK
jgi:hypothetical protein